jgi:predicted Zn-dependent peptidase
MSLQPGEYSKATLSNGITLVAESHPHVRSASVGVWVKVGSSCEKDSESGLSHFIEHMVFKGTERRSAFEIATVLESLGGDLNAFTDREYTCFHSTVLSENLDVALDVLSDLTLRPSFPAAELERERKVLLQELSMVEEAPDDYIADVFLSSIWPKQPIGRSIIGTRQTIRNLSRAQMVRYFKEHYVAENMVISVAGNINFHDLHERCERYFGAIPKGKGKPKKKKSPVYHSAKRSIVMDTEQLHLLLGFEGAGFRDPFRFDALIMSFFLGGGMSSRLFQEIREKAGLAYTVDCDCVPFSDTGILSIYVAMAPRSFRQCMEILAREIASLKEKPITNEQLSVVKGQLKGTILLSNDNMDTRQESLGRNEIVFGRHVSVDEVIGELQRVNTERILEVATRMFVPEKQAVVTLSKAKPKREWVSVF